MSQKLRAALRQSVVLLIGLALVTGCGAARPTSVPPGATPINWDTGGWAYCWLDVAMNVNRCRTFNSAGQRLYQPGHESDDDVFLPDEGSAPVPKAELRISLIRTSPGMIWLENCVVLLPRNAFDGNKRLVDRMKAFMREKDMRELREHDCR